MRPPSGVWFAKALMTVPRVSPPHPPTPRLLNVPPCQTNMKGFGSQWCPPDYLRLRTTTRSCSVVLGWFCAWCFVTNLPVTELRRIVFLGAMAPPDVELTAREDYTTCRAGRAMTP